MLGATLSQTFFFPSDFLTCSSSLSLLLCYFLQLEHTLPNLCIKHFGFPGSDSHLCLRLFLHPSINLLPCNTASFFNHFIAFQIFVMIRDCTCVNLFIVFFYSCVELYGRWLFVPGTLPFANQVLNKYLLGKLDGNTLAPVPLNFLTFSVGLCRWLPPCSMEGGSTLPFMTKLSKES